jgi:hypothetical protein
MSETKAPMDRYPRVLNSTELSILKTAAIVRYGEAKDYTQMHFSRGSLTWCRTVLTGLSGGGDWQTTGYCWPTSFKVLGVLFLEEVYSTFLPSKKAC